MEQIAINGVTTGSAPLEESWLAYGAAGFTKVEMPIAHLKHWLDAGYSHADLRQLLNRAGLRLVGGFEAHLAVFAGAAERDANFALHVANASLLDTLGGGGVLVLGTDGPQERDLEALKVVGRALAELAERVPSSITLALEFNWSPLVRSLHSADLVVQAAEHPRVGILFDMAHWYCTASKAEDLTPDTVSRIAHVHVDDMRDKPGDLSDCNGDRVLPGEGILDLRGIIGRLEAGGYRGVYSLELFNADLWQVPVAEAAKLAYRSMVSLCG